MKLPKDYILHIKSAKDGIHMVAEWQGELVRCVDCEHRKKNKFCLQHNHYAKDDDGFCSWANKGGDSK